MDLRLLLILIPAIIGYATVAKCPMKNSGENVKFRPPPWAFSVVWIICYLTLA